MTQIAGVTRIEKTLELDGPPTPPTAEASLKAGFYGNI
jgi:hypothetical protein